MKMLFGNYSQTIATQQALSYMSGSANKDGLYVSGENFYERIISRPYKKKAYTFSDGKVIEDNELYYFKREPILWDILADFGDCYLLLADKILSAGCFFQSFKDRIINGKTIYRNNWAGSDARKWLNEVFYRKAFSREEKKLILDQKMDIDATNFYHNVFSKQDVSRSNVILPTYQDVTSEEFGFCSDVKAKDDKRSRAPTDYAKAAGAMYFESTGDGEGNGYWWLASSAKNGANCITVYKNGALDMEGGIFNWSQYGYVPCILVAKDASLVLTDDDGVVLNPPQPDEITETAVDDNNAETAPAEGENAEELSSETDGDNQAIGDEGAQAQTEETPQAEQGEIAAETDEIKETAVDDTAQD